MRPASLNWPSHLSAPCWLTKTVKTYKGALSGIERFLEDNCTHLATVIITREHVGSYLSDLLDRWKPAPASNRSWMPSVQDMVCR